MCCLEVGHRQQKVGVQNLHQTAKSCSELPAVKQELAAWPCWESQQGVTVKTQQGVGLEGREG